MSPPPPGPSQPPLGPGRPGPAAGRSHCRSHSILCVAGQVPPQPLPAGDGRRPAEDFEPGSPFHRRCSVRRRRPGPSSGLRRRRRRSLTLPGRVPAAGGGRGVLTLVAALWTRTRSCGAAPPAGPCNPAARPRSSECLGPVRVGSWHWPERGGRK